MLEAMLFSAHNTPARRVYNDTYLGEIAATDLITNADLTALVGLSAGAVANATATWLKFTTEEGKTLHIAKRPFRSAVSYNNLLALDLINGNAKVNIGNSQYLVRIMTGADEDPSSAVHDTSNPVGTDASEWNRLLENVCVANPASRNWAQFTEADLGTVNGATASSTWVSNKSSIGQSNEAATGYGVVRGYKGILNYYVTLLTNNSKEPAWRPVLEYLGPDPYAGDSYQGEVAPADLISNADLTTAVGLTNGTATNTDAGWLKFQTQEGKTLLVAKKPFRYGLSWNQLNALGLTKGTKQVVIAGKTYNVRCIKGADADPATANHNTTNPPGTLNSEWTRLFQNISASQPSNGKKWAAFTDAELGAVVSSGTYANGASTLCYETSTRNQSNAAASGYVVLRRSINNYFVTVATNVNADIGWRPVLELVS
jgi:hypothetical protein